ALAETCFTIDYRRCAVTLATPGDRIDCAPTRGLFIRWRDMRKVGGFRRRLLPHYLSDLEWTFRARRRGLAIRRDQRLWLVPHHELSGPRDLRAFPPIKRVRQIFSHRYAGNPLHWAAFVLLCFPPRYWIGALSRVAWWMAGALFGR